MLTEFLSGDALIAACFTRQGFESTQVIDRIGACGVFFPDFIALLRVTDLVCCDVPSSSFLLLYLPDPFLATKPLAKRRVWVAEWKEIPQLAIGLAKLYGDPGALEEIGGFGLEDSTSESRLLPPFATGGEEEGKEEANSQGQTYSSVGGDVSFCVRVSCSERAQVTFAWFDVFVPVGCSSLTSALSNDLSFGLVFKTRDVSTVLLVGERG